MCKPNYGLVLSGGGAKGAFEMGVWKALRKNNYSIGAVIGTSVGALNAAMIAQNNFDVAMEFWTNITINQVLELSNTMTNNYINTWSKESFEVFRKGFLDILFSDGLDITPLRNNLTHLISEEKIRKSPIRFGLVTVDLTSLKPKQLMIDDIPEGKLIDYLLASAGLPIFQKQEINGNTYIDGGFFDNVPINFMLEQGFKDIISVEFPAPGMRKLVREKNINLITITNSEDLGGIMNFDTPNIKHNIALGYLDALRTFKQLEGNYFYFSIKDNQPIFNRFKSTIGLNLSNPNQHHKLLALLNQTKECNQAEIIDLLTVLLNKTSFKNQPLFLSLLEITGKSLGVPRLEAYTIDSFFQKLLMQLNFLLNENRSILNNPKVFQEFLRPSNHGINRYHFITFYIIFTSIRGDLSPHKMNNFMSKLNPDLTLSMITILYIHQMLNPNA
jgi:NTE family protein